MQNFRPINRFHDKRISFVHYTGTDGDQVNISSTSLCSVKIGK